MMNVMRGVGVMGVVAVLTLGSGASDALHAQESARASLADRIARAVETAIDRAGEVSGRALAAVDAVDVEFEWGDGWGWYSGPEDGPLVQEEFRWSGRVGPGDLLEIKGVNGPMEVRPAEGDQVEIVVVKSGRRNDPTEVRMDVLEHDGGVTVCAVYPTPPGKEANLCGPGEEGRNTVRRNDVRVQWQVRVPSGVRLRGRTVNGSVEVTGLADAVDVATVNGDVLVETRAFASARTVNGSVRARMDGPAPGGATFETVNGSIHLDVDEGLDADLDAGWLNGALETELPFTVQGTMGRRSARGSLGDGGNLITVRTVNGSIRIF